VSGGSELWCSFGACVTSPASPVLAEDAPGKVQPQRLHKQLNYGKAGSKAEYCRGHAEDGMVNVMQKTCAHGGCS